MKHSKSLAIWLIEKCIDDGFKLCSELDAEFRKVEDDMLPSFENYYQEKVDEWLILVKNNLLEIEYLRNKQLFDCSRYFIEYLIEDLCNVLDDVKANYNT